MSSLNPYGAIMPDSTRFATYLDHLRSKWVDEGVRPQRINSALILLRELERLRLCYSKCAEAAFISQKIANSSLAQVMGYKTNRQVQKIRQWLEEQGVLSAKRQKVNALINKWNSYVFSGFREWFIQTYQQACSKTGHPKEESDLRSLSGAKPKTGICFPRTNLNSWDSAMRFWRVIAQEVSESPPCLSKLSEKFRLNLRKHQIPLDHPSVIGRWKGYVKRAVEFQKRTERPA